MEKFASIKKATKHTFILVLLSVLLIKISSCLMKFIESSTYTASKFVKQDQAEFPSMTICNENGYKNEVLNFHGILSKQNYMDCDSKNISWSSNNTIITEMELYDKITYKFHELVSKIYIRLIKTIDVRLFVYFHLFDKTKNCLLESYLRIKIKHIVVKFKEMVLKSRNT